MADNISFKWDESTEVTTGKNGYTEAQQRDYMIRTSTDLVKENRTVQEEELKTDPNFIDSMRILHAKEEGADTETPPDEELVKWGLGYLADVNYNLVDLGEAAYDFTEATDLERMAMTYGLETYDAKDVTWDGVQRFASAFATDPTNLIGFGTLGAGFAAKFAGKGVAKQAFKKMLMNPANIAALEGAAFMGTEDVMRQDLEVDVGMKEEYDPMQTVGMATVGAVGGKVLGEGASWLGKKLKKAPSEVVNEVQTIQNELNAPEVKSEFGAELLVGGIAGIEQDEEGNVSFDPMKFMAGFLGGHVAKKIMTNPRLNAKAKKEAMAYAQRTFDKLDANPKFDYVTGTMRAVENRGATKTRKQFIKDYEKEYYELLDKEVETYSKFDSIKDEGEVKERTYIQAKRFGDKAKELSKKIDLLKDGGKLPIEEVKKTTKELHKELGNALTEEVELWNKYEKIKESNKDEKYNAWKIANAIGERIRDLKLKIKHSGK